MTSAGANAAAIAAALNGTAPQVPPHNRQSWNLKSAGIVRASDPTLKSPNTLNHNETYVDDDDVMQDDDDVADGMPDGRAGNSASRARTRRASEGAYLSKGEGKRASGELRCEKCGKGYKHSSCLTKHRWEHTPEWSYTSKLLISKHQQVQLLEAASVLVGMNQDEPFPPDTPKIIESDQSSASPDISATSELHDDEISSAETTPPPMNEPSYFHDSFTTVRTKRNSGTSSAFSRSYQSAPSSSFLAGSIPSSSYGQQYPSQRRPSTSGVASTTVVDDDEANLAAAVQSLCSFGTPRTGPVHLPADVPPVPPLPAQYAGQSINRLSANTMAPTPFEFGLAPVATQRTSNERGSRPVSSHKAYSNDDDDTESLHKHPNRNDDDEDGVFGRMDE
ncbi:MAG: hypothetical protein LQ339_008877 [Xanthoria mediterranea]|nr:MAG: hypothetical protein LQ339_008877 [Xanthoria mediterranea]